MPQRQRQQSLAVPTSSVLDWNGRSRSMVKFESARSGGCSAIFATVAKRSNKRLQLAQSQISEARNPRQPPSARAPPGVSETDLISRRKLATDTTNSTTLRGIQPRSCFSITISTLYLFHSISYCLPCNRLPTRVAPRVRPPRIFFAQAACACSGCMLAFCPGYLSVPA